MADFIGDSNIIPATMIEDKLVSILGTRFACVDTGFGHNKPVDVVIRPEAESHLFLDVNYHRLLVFRFRFVHDLDVVGIDPDADPTIRKKR